MILQVITAFWLPPTPELSLMFPSGSGLADLVGYDRRKVKT